MSKTNEYRKRMSEICAVNTEGLHVYFKQHHTVLQQLKQDGSYCIMCGLSCCWTFAATML